MPDVAEGMARDGLLGEFLRTRRARLRPEEVGATPFGGQRRVPGLRREELAQVAGVSVDYYTRLEQGRAPNVSADVLDAVAQALGLDENERAHLHNLALPAQAVRRAAPVVQRVGPELRQALAAITGVPAYVVGRRLEVLAWNDLARVLVADFPALTRAERTMPHLVFLDTAARDVFPDWEHKARETVAHLRLDAGRHPGDPELAALIDELSDRSDDFRRLWADHDVRARTRGRKRFRHPLTGEFELDYISMKAPDDPDLALVIYSAPPGGAAECALRTLSSVPV